MKKSVSVMLLLVLSLFLLVGCQRAGTWCPSPGVCIYPEEIPEEEFDKITEEIIIPEEEQQPQEITVPDVEKKAREIIVGYIGANRPKQQIIEALEEEEIPNDIIQKLMDEYFPEADIIVTEGELVKLAPQATDPEGDVVTFTFSEPLDGNGEWQTEIGDAGTYEIIITASDGVNEVTQTFVILVRPANQPPVITIAATLDVDEGDTIILEPEVSDPEGDDVEVSFSGWMTSDTYKTTYNDAGEYIVTITATDGINEVSKDILITISDVNRPPVMEKIDDITLMEEEEVSVDVDATDPDGDALVIEFSEPLDGNGEWQTEIGDGGTYEVTVTVSDGINEISQDFNIIVEAVNQPPVITIAATLDVDEGDTIILEPEVSDPEGDDVEVSFSGWMTSDTYKTTYNDAGEHIVTITATDGINEVNKDILITISDVNRPPEFVLP